MARLSILMSPPNWRHNSNPAMWWSCLLQAGWDNLNVHKSPRAREAIRARDAWVLCLPRYSPDLNPIEKAFSKLKTLLRKRKARTYDALWKAVGHICHLLTPQECWNYFKAAQCLAE